MADRGRPREFDRDVALRKAMLVFWSKGFEETSMLDLVEATGVRSASLYAAFGSKESFFKEAVSFYRDNISPTIWNSLDEDVDIEEALSRFLIRTAHAFANTDFPAGCFVVLGAHHARGGQSAIGDELRRRRAEDIDRLRKSFDRAVQADQLPVDFDTDAAAKFFAALQAGMSILARDGADEDSLRRMANGGAKAFAAMRHEPPSGQPSKGVAHGR